MFYNTGALNFLSLFVLLFINHMGKPDTAAHDFIVPLKWKQSRLYFKLFVALVERSKV